MSLLPPPIDFGLPAKFTHWRQGQDRAVLHAMDAPQRFVGMVLPTGAGKSVIYMGTAHLQQVRAVVLTSTKALQRQLEEEFTGMGGVALMQGQRGYQCVAMAPGGELVGVYGNRNMSGYTSEVMVDHGPCHLGVECSKKALGCTYYGALRGALKAQILVTNYAWWLTLVERPDIRLSPDLLILDEAHAAPDALADALGAEVLADDVDSLLGIKLARADEMPADEWSQWTKEQGARLAQRLEGTKPNTREAASKLRRAQWLLRSLVRVAAIDPKLLLISDAPEGVRFDVVWAAPYAERYLFRHTPKVLLTSATFTPHTADLLGIAPAELSVYESNDSFPVKRRPVYVAPAILYGLKPVRVDHKMTGEEETAWLNHMDNIHEPRADRKGIVHSISYRRRDLIMARSKHAGRMMTHGRFDTAKQIALFKQAPAGTILVSPSMTTGYDFPMAECEYQIICKIPFPDSRDPVTSTRTQIDKAYPAYVAMQELVQMCGRPMRSADDQAETFIVDAHATWFLRANHKLAPRWFRRAIVSVTRLPAPPPPLRTSQP